MKNDLNAIYDNTIENAVEIANEAQEKTSEFHENYVTKVTPDFGKYGDKVTFAAELIPGVAEYNDVIEGDWKAFAIDAGIDAAAIAVGAFSAGAGYAVVKGGGVAAKTGLKVAAKEAAEKGIKEVAKEGIEKAGKEAVEAGVEKAAKEVAEEGTEKVAKETGEKAGEKVVKEVGDSMDKKLFPDYIKEVEKITNRKLDPKQLEKVEDAMKNQDFPKLSPEETELRRKLFNSAREDLIKEWETNTGKIWPRYEKDVISPTGTVRRYAGQAYDAHHLIELDFRGPNEWWNLHPAAFPDEHQGGIHAAGNLARKMF